MDLFMSYYLIDTFQSNIQWMKEREIIYAHRQTLVDHVCNEIDWQTYFDGMITSQVILDRRTNLAYCRVAKVKNFKYS